MPWSEIKVETQRQKFIEAYLAKDFSLTELCRQFEISRPTGYKWVERFKQFGKEGLIELSKAPLSHPNATSIWVTDKILELRSQKPHWGARKIRGYLTLEYPEERWPSDTTVHNILERQGCVIPRRARRRVSPQVGSLTDSQGCNEVWCVDFKGWFLTEDGQKCEPLTMTDNYSRYLLHSAMLPRNNTEHVWDHFDYAFREYGLPLFMRSDNGAPFGSTGVGRLCKLAIKLIKAGVTPEWISPGKPQENGRHERMHRTLKSEVANPPAKTIELQRKRLEEFQEYYNHERPHQSLGQKTPGSVYVRSPREWYGKLKSPDYDEEWEAHKVASCGKISMKGKGIYIGRVLKGEYVGLRENSSGYEVSYGPVYIGQINQEGVFERPRAASRRTKKQEAS